MSSPYYLQIQDVNGPKYFAPDVVPQQVMDAYGTQINYIMSAYNQYINDPSSVTAATYQMLASARSTLIDYATNGINLGPLNGTGYLNQSMARALDTLLKTFDIAGIGSATGPANQLASVQQWLDLSTAGLGSYIASASTAAASGRSIQAMVQLEYIKAGNDLITNKLGALETALGYTQSAVSLLTTLQNIQNKASTGTTGTFNPGGTGDDYVDNFQSQGNNVFNKQIPVTATPSSADRVTWLQYASSTGPLMTLISQLMPQYGYSDSSVLNQVPLPSALVGSLPAALYKVYSDMQVSKQNATTAGLDVSFGCDYWIVDNMGVVKSGNVTKTSQDTSLQGDYSNNLTTAQTAAQSLNDQQKQSVQQTLFLFQEFYQSGSGMLTLINQIIQAMAQAISR